MDPKFVNQENGQSRAVVREETPEETAAREKAHAAEAKRRAAATKPGKGKGGAGDDD